MVLAAPSGAGRLDINDDAERHVVEIVVRLSEGSRNFSGDRFQMKEAAN
jgi:hypothetical protein